MRYILEEDDIEWEMNWDNVQGVNTIGKEIIFSEEMALSHLLLNEVVFINSQWWRKEDVPEDMKLAATVFVNCNDVFAWGCADGEILPHGEIEILYRMWRKDPRNGPAAWCINIRKQMPQKAVEKEMREAGIWNLEELMGGDSIEDAS